MLTVCKVACSLSIESAPSGTSRTALDVDFHVCNYSMKLLHGTAPNMCCAHAFLQQESSVRGLCTQIMSLKIKNTCQKNWLSTMTPLNRQKLKNSAVHNIHR